MSFQPSYMAKLNSVVLSTGSDLHRTRDEQKFKTVAKAFPEEMAVGSLDVVPTSVLEGKFTPLDSGGTCTCASSKNYSRVFSMSPGAWGQYSMKVAESRSVDVYDTPSASPHAKTDKPWTLMFFFASDNSLSPSTLPQLKAIKAAGRSDNANVLVYFDPNERGAPARVFAINEELDPTIASTSGDPVISVLSSDYLRPDFIQVKGPESKAFVHSLRPGNDGLKADTALEQFLDFCHETYPAEHYMLFLVGHGLVVGRDAFLPDDNPYSAIGLKTLGEILNKFKYQIGDDALELIGMHNCSMSAVEVAYELKGTANYMLASQGHPTIVDSWPYRQLLTKIYHDVEKGEVNVSELVRSFHALCIKYSVDFIHAGYSSDMTLCSLREDHVRALTKPISNLSQALQDGMTIPRCRDLIVLAHWRAQSYWQETYTDLCDFCLCLKWLCKDPFNGPSFEDDVKRNAIIQACDSVIDTLKPDGSGPIVCTDYVGPDLQYSHGLSIYFPWSDPVEDEKR